MWTLSKSKLDGNISMFVGKDLNKNYLQIALMNEKGKVLENSKINNNLKQVGRFFDENINDGKVRVVMESSSVWYNIYSYLSEEKHLNVVSQVSLNKPPLLPSSSNTKK